MFQKAVGKSIIKIDVSICILLTMDLLITLNCKYKVHVLQKITVSYTEKVKMFHFTVARSFYQKYLSNKNLVSNCRTYTNQTCIVD